MKQCPRCGKTYEDDQLNFCLEDGEILTSNVSHGGWPSDSPPTVMMSDARRTNPTNWPHERPPPSPMAPGQHPGQMNMPGGFPLLRVTGPSQTLAIVSLCLGGATVTIGWCCSSGMVLGPAAIITGIISLIFIKNEPDKYTGKGLAMGGIGLGAAYFVILIVFFIIYGAVMIGGGLLGGR